MYDYVFELGVNLFQSFMFIGFFYLFFEPKYEKVRNIILFFVFVILNFAMLTYFTYFPSFHIIIDSLIAICFFEIYVLLCLKGNTILKIVMPFIAFLINTIISYGFINLTSFLSELRADMYEKNIISSNKQIEEMSKIKHDTANQIASINQLIVNKNYDEAHNVCIELIERMKAVYTPINTNNPVLNAVMNVEMEKAKTNGISFKTEINDEMIEFKNNTDLISLIGNLCDNAIEYLSTCSESIKYMELSITRHNDYFIISCKNRIDSSILADNPDLQTSKSNKSKHGKGLSIINDVVNKYNGNLSFQENNGWFIVNVILESSILPENA